MFYDYIVVGSGLFGSIFARELTNKGYKCLVLEKRAHIGGNCYTEKRDEINLHIYGAHIFHTSNEKVWKWINNYVNFNNFTHTVVANYKGEIYPLPFNMWTFNKFWKVTSPKEVKEIISNQSNLITKEPKNLKEQSIKFVGEDIYNTLIKGYTEKQWMKKCEELPPSIIKRLPIRLTYDNRYFEDTYQGIPIGGYTQLFEKLLDGIEIKFEVDYLKDKEFWNSQGKKIVYTGPIDAFFDYCFGELEYKTTFFDHQKIMTDNFQGVAVMNFTDNETKYTRIIEHKHFENIKSNVTWITYEYPTEYKAKVTEPYYPVNDEINNKKYLEYKELSEKYSNMIFGGRLAEYKYYDMHQVIEVALNRVEKESL